MMNPQQKVFCGIIFNDWIPDDLVVVTFKYHLCRNIYIILPILRVAKNLYAPDPFIRPGWRCPDFDVKTKLIRAVEC